MKKVFVMAAVFVAGAATVGIAQHAKESRSENSFKTISNTIAAYQDTTKPVNDSIPEKKDSTTIKF